MASSPTAEGQVFIGPGLKPAKLILTLAAVLGVTTLVLWIALREGAPAIGSTIVALVFITGFLIYLRIVAPVPFTISLEPEALVKRSRNGEVIEVRWEDLPRIKEEFFPNGKRIGITVYRDDVTDIDRLAGALKEAIPATCQWQSETVHE